MTQHRNYADLIAESARDSGARAAALADAYELATTLGDSQAASNYLGQIQGINIVLHIINDKLGTGDE